MKEVEKGCMEKGDIKVCHCFIDAFSMLVGFLY